MSEARASDNVAGRAMFAAYIVKARREFTVEVELRLARGECLALFGPSGAGKSTVLSCIAGFEAPDRGEIRLFDRRVFPPSAPLYSRPLAYLTQKDLLFPHLTVGENVCFGLNGARVSAEDDSRRAANADWIAELRRRLGLERVWDAPARAISGGQARRAAIARMLARRPPLVLLDEPFASLDSLLIFDLVELLLEWQASLNFALIAADHRRDILMRLCPRVAAIERGRIVQEGRWEELTAAPATPTLLRLLAKS
jgi:ABC-type sulfate/molybdate transport systems ATPase subunit